MVVRVYRGSGGGCKEKGKGEGCLAELRKIRALPNRGSSIISRAVELGLLASLDEETPPAILRARASMLAHSLPTWIKLSIRKAAKNTEKKRSETLTLNTIIKKLSKSR